MTIAHCPKCHEQVSIPLGASRQARVRCPLCSEEYLLDDALRPLPPLLVVVHDPEARTSAVLDESRSLAPVVAGLKRDDAPPTESEEAFDGLSFEPSAPVAVPAFKFDAGSAVSAARDSSVATRPRARRKQGGTLRMMVQTIGGGMMGLVVAQLILWWMPGNWAKENRDPFGLAPKVALYALPVVPIALRGNAPSAQADRAANAPRSDLSRGDTASVAGDNAGPKTSGGFETNIPEFTFNPNAPAEGAKSQAGRNNKNQEMEMKNAAAKPEEFPSPGLNEPSAPDKAPTKEPDAFAPPEVNKAADITARLTDVTSAERAWDTAENPTNEKKLELITDLYVKLAQLGDTVARMGESKDEAAELWQPVVEKLNALAVQSDKLVPLGKLAGWRLKDDRDKGGILVGVVLSHQPRGKMFETQLRLLAKSDPVVTVVSATDLGEQLPANTNVLVLGRWISNPAENLAGYEGDAESVLLHGVHVAVPAATPQP